VQEAQTAAEGKDWATVAARSRDLLSEDPANARAQALIRQAEEANAKPANDARLAAALHKSLSIDFKEATVKQAFDVFAKTSGVNFVFDRDVKTDQKTTLTLKDTSVKEAMDLVLVTNQLEQRVLDRNTILVYPATPAKIKDYQPLTMRTFFLAHADVEQVATALRTLVKTRDLVVDKKQNMLMMRDTPDVVRVAEKVVALHDLPEPEVMLEVEVLEVSRNRLLELGIKYPGQVSLAPIPSASGSTLTLQDLRNRSAANVGVTMAPLTASARAEDGDVNLLANPRIRARNRETAKILIGDKVPNITSTSTSTGFVAETVQYLDVGLKLEVSPVVAINGEVAIKVALEVSNVAGQVRTTSGTLAFQIGTRSASTTLRLKDGENQVLAGLINDEDRRTGSKVPGFGHIPVVGRLFGSSLEESKKTEIVLSITPRVLRNTPRPAQSMLEFDAGTESNARSVAVVPAVPAVPAVPSPEPVRRVPEAATPLALPTPVAVASTPVASGPTNTPTGLHWQGPARVKVGEPFNVQLLLNAPQTVTAMPYVVSFDPAVLEVVSVQEGDVMRSGGADSVFNQRVDRGTGQVFITSARQGSATNAPMAPGVLLSMTLRPLAAAPQTQLQLGSVSPVGTQGATVALPVPLPLAVTVAP
jgi:general secretion pathway protein D